MGAISTAMLALLSPGDHFLTQVQPTSLKAAVQDAINFFWRGISLTYLLSEVLSMTLTKIKREASGLQRALR